jgi:hypothetical protein
MSSDPFSAILAAMHPDSRPNGNMKWNCQVDGCYRDQLPDWSPFNDCFPRTGIRITDIDGMVEIGGHFLFIEWKRPGSEVPDGQMKAFQRLTNHPGITVLIVWGDTTDNPTAWRVIHGGDTSKPTRLNFDQFYRSVTEWATAADSASHRVPSRPSGTGTHRREPRPESASRPPLGDAPGRGTRLAQDAPNTTPQPASGDAPRDAL